MLEQWIAGVSLTGIVLAHLIGLAHAVHVLIHVRSSQGAIAWLLGLFVLPYVTIPFYWLAGRTRFSGYVRARRAGDGKLRQQYQKMHEQLREHALEPTDAFGRAAEFLGGLPFTKGNELELLIDGEETFPALFEAIEKAEHYLLINFYILKNDRVGTRFKNALIERAQSGVEVYLIFDGFGSHSLPKAYIRDLQEGGVRCSAFGINRMWWSRLHINFRNHRKIVLIDGKEAFIGGFNIGDEYLGRDPKFGNWRDTHMRITGPAVLAIQLVFIEDWHWVAGDTPNLLWQVEVREANQTTAILPTGPSDPADSWQLTVAEAANSARERLWITSPYFVPDGGVLTALQTAALRGVDVRIMIPEKPDHLTVWLAAFSYQRETLPFGIKIYKYTEGFLHQKVFLIDDRMAGIGTANLDNRSFRLNFEITALATDAEFIKEVETMLEEDFSLSRQLLNNELDERGFLFRLWARIARLFSPIL